MAEDLLRPYGDLLIALSTVLRIKRTLDGAEIDEIIWDVLVRNTVAVETGDAPIGVHANCLPEFSGRMSLRRGPCRCHIVPKIGGLNQQHVDRKARRRYPAW